MKKLIVALSFLACGMSAFAQDGEPGGFRTGLSVEKEITKKWTLGTEAEFRSLGYNLNPERYILGINTDYELFKNFKVGIGYEYQSVKDSYKWGYSSLGVDTFKVWMQPRHRFQADISYKYSLGDFSISIRERAQATFKNDKDRIKQNGDTNFARVNPDQTWRNRIKLDYNIPNSKFDPSFSFESYMLWNDPDIQKAYFSKLKYTLAVEYKINKKNSVELYGMYSNERSAEEQVVSGPNYYIIGDWGNNTTIGINYTIKL